MLVGMLNVHTLSTDPHLHTEPGICDSCDEPGLVLLTRRHGAICTTCYAEHCDHDGFYVRVCECCSARERIEYDDGRPWICPDCRYNCHDWDDQGD
jgi:hypothetical protein